MKRSEKLTLIGLLALVVLTVAGLILTRTSPGTKAGGANQQTPAAGGEIVDQRHLQTARQLSALATTPEEVLLAQDAVRVADHEVDLAFAAALEDATHQTATQSTGTPETRALEQRIEKIQAAIETRKQTIQQLTAESKTARGPRDNLQQQIQVAQTELDLLQDVLGDVKDDLARAGGDRRSRIQQLMEEHQAAEHAAAPSAAAATLPAAASGSLIAQWGNWSAMRQKRGQILQAQQDAFTAAAGLARTHDALQK